jgi:hypothetical protein
MILQAAFLVALVMLRVKGRAKWWLCAMLWTVVLTGFQLLMGSMNELYEVGAVEVLFVLAFRGGISSLYFWLLERFDEGGFYWVVLILGSPAMIFFG